MKSILFIIASLIFIGSGIFFYFSHKGTDNPILFPPQEVNTAIEGWPDGVFESPALKEIPKELKGKFDTSEWETYANEKMGIAFRYPAKTDGFVLNLKPHIMEENSVGPWYTMDEVAWLVTIHLVEEIRNDAEGFFVTSIFKKEGKFEDVVQKVREFTVSGKMFLSERAVKIGTLQGIRIATVNKEETSYAIAYVLRASDVTDKTDMTDQTDKTDRNFIIDIAIDRIYDPAETEEQFTERVLREQQYFDAVASTFQML